MFFLYSKYEFRSWWNNSGGDVIICFIPTERVVIREAKWIKNADRAPWNLCCMSPPSLLLIRLSDRFVRNNTPTPTALRRYTWQKGYLCIHFATWKDWSLLTFASAVAVVAIATPSCWRRNGGAVTRGGQRGVRRGRWIINQCPQSVASPASDTEVNGDGRELFSAVARGGEAAAGLLLWLWHCFL